MATVIPVSAEPARDDRMEAKRLAASILVKRTDRFVLKFLRAIAAADPLVDAALLELRQRGYKHEAAKLVPLLERDVEVAMFGRKG